MISSTEIVSCPQIQVATDEPGYIDFSLSTEIFDGGIKAVVVKISAPKVKSEVLLSGSVVKVYDELEQEISPSPPSWGLSSETEKTLKAFIEASYPRAKVKEAVTENKTEAAIERIEKNLDVAADFVAKTLFFYIKGLSPDDIDRAKASFIGKVTERIIHCRNATINHARRKIENSSSNVVHD